MQRKRVAARTVLAQEIPSPKELAAAGRALRDKVPRERLGAWKPAAHREDPIKMLHASDRTRLKDLVPIRYGRMLPSPFTFYRGSAMVMAADLASQPRTGATVQACGDCHLLNFGGFATPERNIVFSINDFDETLPAPWEWDVKRLAASFVLAARANGLSDAVGHEAATAAASSYRKRVREYAAMHPLEVWYSSITAADAIAAAPRRARAQIARRIEQASAHRGSEVDYPKLAATVAGKASILDRPPLIYHPKSTEGAAFRVLLADVHRAYRETLPDDRRTLLDRYRVADAAIKVVGVGSVGMRCWIVLLMSAANEPLFLQFKEAVASVLEPYVGKSRYEHHGRRVVMGQRLMQPASDLFLGWATARNGAQFYARQLRDAKIKPLVETFNAAMLTHYAKLCGWALALSHAKGGDVSLLHGYLGSSDEFDEAIGKFALAYADQAERDHAALKAAVRKGQIEVYRE